MNNRKLLIIAVILLVLARIITYFVQSNEAAKVEEHFIDWLPAGSTVETIAKNTYKISKNNSLVGYAGFAEYNGYGGPMLVGIITDTKGVITKLQIIDHKDTPQYISRITKEGYFLQYEKKDITTGTTFGEDIQGISGATLSTRAVAMCVDQVSENIRVKALGLPPHTASIPWQVGLTEIFIALLIVLLLLQVCVAKLNKLRYLLLILSVVIIGFWLNRPVTIAQISGMFLGYFPAIKTNLSWYLLLAIALLPVIITGKNYYCTYLCPFGAVQEGISFATKRINLPLTTKSHFMHNTRNLLTFVALFVAIVFQNPNVGNYEPFAALFSLKATIIQTFLVVAVLAAAIFFKRFWCKGFCPVGGFLNVVAGIRRSAEKQVKKQCAKTHESMEKTCKQQCAAAESSPQELSPREKLADSMFKLFYAIIVFSVVVSIFEKWSFM